MIKMPPTQTAYFPLKGGLNLVTPPLSTPDGMCRDAINFECDVDGGYRRIDGYERFDGKSAPSDEIYYSLAIATFTGASISNGAVIEGAVSGATGIVIAKDDTTIFIVDLVGQFLGGGEDIEIASVVVAHSYGIAVTFGASTPKLNAYYKSLAANYQRDFISEVPGSCPVRGVWVYKDNVYAFRDAEDGLSGAMYRASNTGWVQIAMQYEIAFANGNIDVALGTLTRSGVTATILKVIVETGTLDSVVNTGRLIINVPTGGNFTAGAATTSTGGTLTLSGAQSQIAIPAGGRYEFVNYNFSGSFNSLNMYGVSGVGKAFEFDGTLYSPINTGLPEDKPTHLVAHVNYLFVSYDSSVIRSSIANPFRFEAITGAAEYAAGEPITAIHPIVGSNSGSAMVVLTKNKTLVIYGSTEADFQIVTFNDEAGASPYTVQAIGDVYMLDQLGVRQLSSSQNFGNFDDAQLSRIIRPWIISRISKGVASCVVRQKNQYRIYFSDKHALYLTFYNGKIIGMMPCRFSHTFNCVASKELLADGEEMIVAGGTDGFVYRLNKGTSFDGLPIDYNINLSFSYMRGPRVRKHWRKAVYELTGMSYGEIESTYEIGYTDPDINQGQGQMLEISFSPVAWDNFTWDSFYWDGRTLVPLEQKLYGTAENISLLLRGRSDQFEPFTINSVMIHHTPRRQMR